MPYIPVATVNAATSGGLFSAYALLRDEKAANTDGGTFTTGAWRTRTLNTEVFDVGGIVSLAANQFTLLAGTYFIIARSPARGVGRNKCKIANITDTADTLIGSSQNPGLNAQTDATVQGRFTIAGAKVFELQHACEVTGSTNGFGIASDWSGSPTSVTEVYAEVLIYKEA